jgi:hypothetical protein
MLNGLAEFTPLLTLMCPLVVGPLCFLLILGKWVGRRMPPPDRDLPVYNRRLAVSLVIWLPLTGLMGLLSLFYLMGDRLDDAPREVSFGELAPWLAIPVVYVCVGAGLVYLMWAPADGRLR